VDELHRADLLGVDHVIFHPGSHGGRGTADGSQRIVDALTWAVGEVPKGTARILLENAAGQGNAVGSTFEELSGILDRLAPKERFGVTIDTCHLFAAGNDFRTAEGYGAVVDKVRSTIGIRRVGAFHLNDSKADVGQHLDRHENIGKGHIGTAGFKFWVNDSTWAKVPGYLETPIQDNEYAAYIADLATLRGLID
jgi:deoxyribonuclease-4